MLKRIVLPIAVLGIILSSFACSERVSYSKKCKDDHKKVKKLKKGNEHVAPGFK